MENFICQECGKEFKKFKSLVTHIQFKHNNKDYFDNYIKKEGEGFCKICGDPTKFYSIGYGYYTYCSKKCKRKGYSLEKKKNNPMHDKKTVEKQRKTNLKRYGVERNTQRKEIKDNIKKTNLEKYGCENVIQNKKIFEKAKNKRNKTNLKKYGKKEYFGTEESKLKIKTTFLNKYGFEHATQSNEIKQKIRNTNLQKYGFEYAVQSNEIKQKIRNTNLQKYGFEHATQSNEIKQKIKNTNFRKYGVLNPSQDPSIFLKQRKNSFLTHNHPCGLNYQGTYEKDFLDNYFHKTFIKNGLSFKYKEGDKTRVYHSDFYIPSRNLIIEIKNSYLAKRDKDNINAKKEAVIEDGFNWLLIVDKNYEELDNFLGI
ncbi:MAG: DUF7487 domain-containing protein [bacterium]